MILHWLTLVIASCYTITHVHSVPLLPTTVPTNVSALSIHNGIGSANFTHIANHSVSAHIYDSSSLAVNITSTPINNGENLTSYPSPVGNLPVAESAPLAVSAVVPKSLPDSEISSADDLLDYDADSGPFLLMCSVKSIRYWSPKCALHSSNELLAHPPIRTNPRHGFSGLSVRRAPVGKAIEMIWFDVEKYEFHLARLARRANSTNCDNPLTFSYNTTLNYASNPRAGDYAIKHEKMVKIASSEGHLMIANFLLDRIDVYRLNESHSNMTFVESISAVRPSDIVFQRNNLLWLENGFRICRLKHFFGGHRPAEPQCHETKNETIHAFTVFKNRQILYSTRVPGHLHANIYRLDWHTFESQQLGPIDPPEIVSMSSMSSDIVFLSENDGQVHRLNITKGLQDLYPVTIETSTLFDITFMEDDFDAQLEESYTETARDITTEAASEIITEAASEIIPEAASDDYHSQQVILVSYNPHKLLIIFFVACVIASVTICVTHLSRRPAVRQRFSTLQSKLPNARGLLRNIRPYAQMRQTRAASMSNALIDEDDCDTVSTSNFRQNISVHRPIAANDIEDLLGGNGGVSIQQSSARCIACRDPGICQDKGLCMATYRTQQQ